MATLNLFDHQHEFVTDLEHRYIALRAGLGAGKSFAFCAKALHLASVNCQMIGDHVGIICEPTYPLIKDVLIPTMEEVMDFAGIHKYEITTSAGTPEIKVWFAHGVCTMKMRSAENFKRLIGINAAWAGIDEMDTMPNDIQKQMWVRVNARLRKRGALRQTFVTSTPEGFKFMNQFFVEDVIAKPEMASKVRVIEASTYDNKTLDDQYIEDNKANMTDEQVEAWVYGKVVNMTTGRIYRKYDRKENNSDVTIESLREAVKGVVDRWGRPVGMPELHIGMDFNIDKMAAVIHIIDKDGPIAIDELIGLRDTEEMINVIKSRLSDFRINIYPDSSGKNRSHANATSDTDIKMLQKAGFSVHFDSTNPPVRDRINSMNVAFCNSEGVRKYRVNSKTCPQYVQGLERQVYNSVTGEPDKDGKYDHANDAAGYMIFRKFPIEYRRSSSLRLAGMY